MSSTVSSVPKTTSSPNTASVRTEVKKAMDSIRQRLSSTASRFRKSPGLKFKYSLYSALAFFLLASPQMYLFVNSLVGWVVKVSEPNGCPTPLGLVLHTLVFLALLYFMMSLPKDVN